MTADPLNAATFEAQLGTIFRLGGDGARIPLRLTEVTKQPIRGGCERFSAFFEGPANRVVAQGTYTFEHEALGSLTLFIVPVIGSNAERIVYEACFNRFVQAPSP
jgi:hypothetical protein